MMLGSSAAGMIIGTNVSAASGTIIGTNVSVATGTAVGTNVSALAGTAIGTNISTEIGREAGFLGISVLLGMGLFFLYDILRIFRRIVPHGNIWIGIEDFVYWLLCTGAVFIMLYRGNEGMVRGFALGGVGIGMLLYFLLLSRFVIKINVFVIKKILGFFAKILHTLLAPGIWVWKKTWGFFRKQLKKIFRAVKIGLCKR